MSELTADQAIKIVRDLFDNAHELKREKFEESQLVVFIRTQSARVAELEKVVRPEFFEEQKVLHARIAELEQNQEDIENLGNRTLDFLRVEGVHPVDEVGRLREAARWKSCKDEPPEDKCRAVVRHGYEKDWYEAIYLGPSDGRWASITIGGYRIVTPYEYKII